MFPRRERWAEALLWEECTYHGQESLEVLQWPCHATGCPQRDQILFVASALHRELSGSFFRKYATGSRRCGCREVLLPPWGEMCSSRVNAVCCYPQVALQEGLSRGPERGTSLAVDKTNTKASGSTKVCGSLAAWLKGARPLTVEASSAPHNMKTAMLWTIFDESCLYVL